MREAERSIRIPLCLDIQVKRRLWEHHLTEDVSARGFFVRLVGHCALDQVLQVRILLPGNLMPLEVLARVVRRVTPWTALTERSAPGIGLEFFCVSTHVLTRWEELFRTVVVLSMGPPSPNGYTLFRKLSQEPPSRALLEAVPVRPLTEKQIADRSNLIFRAHTLNRLEQFLDDELMTGQFKLRIPYRFQNGTPVTLRVVRH